MKKLLIVVLILVVAGVSVAEDRFALIIGNGAYQHFAPLQNPENDAADLSAELESLGFRVETLINATEREMFNAVREMGDRLAGGQSVGLFYYAGHGIEVGGTNYLIPVDADIRAEDEVRFASISIDLVLSKMESARNGTNLIILDACRDNPLPASSRSSATRGLATVDAPTGSMVIYATAPGDVALDGQGRNGVFTEALLEHMATPGLDVELMIRRVREDVISNSGGRQTPWHNSSLTTGFSFVPGGSGRPSGGLQPVVVQPTGPSGPVITPVTGEIAVSVETGGDLYLNGQRIGALTAGQSVVISQVETGRQDLEMRYNNGETEQLQVTVRQDRTEAAAFSFSTTPVITAQPTPAPSGGDAIGDTPAAARAVSVGQTITGQAIDFNGDRDYYRITPQGGAFTRGNASIRAYTTGGTDTYIEVFGPGDPNRQLTYNDDSEGLNAGVEFPAQAGQTYWILVRAFGSNTGSYTMFFEADEIAVDRFEPNNSSSQAAQIASHDSSYEVNLGTGGDEDWYTLVIPSGSGRSGAQQTLNVETESELDTRISVFDQNMREIMSDDDGGDRFNARVMIPMTNRSQTVFVQVRGYSSSTTGEYTLRISRDQVAVDQYEPDNSMQQAGEAPFNMPPQARTLSTPSDEDWVRVDLPAGRYPRGATVILETMGSTDTYLEFYDQYGNEIETSDDDGEGLNGRIQMRVQPGTYYLKVRAFGSGGNNLEYTLTASLMGSK